MFLLESRWLAKITKLVSTVVWCIMYISAVSKLTIIKSLYLLTDLIESISSEGVSRSRKIYHDSISDIIQMTLQLFPVFIHQPG